MTNLPFNAPNPENAVNDDVVKELLRKLRQKQGNWVEWGEAIASLQKLGYNPQEIFEETGFEPIQQNQVIVGSQVYNSLAQGGATDATRSHYATRGSDILYELRLLTHEERAAAAELTFIHKLDMDEAREVAKAIKDFSRFKTLPAGFSEHPGDAVAYQSWKLARQYTDLQERSRLIAKGLRFAHTPTARNQIEQLLVDFTVVSQRQAPILPFYRFESEEELPRIVPVAGKLPLTPEDLQGVPMVESIQPFGLVKFAGEQAWVPLPGWQVLLSAEDPVVILCNSDRFPNQETNPPRPLLVVVDRAARQWDDSNYFVVEHGGELDFQWFETDPQIPLLGRIIVIVRPKKIFDEVISKDFWQIDE
ncbi:RuBisCO accumulation factor 1 [Nodularia harveyana UHCC-0300]|uniref:RuBisCO accumulation factor 1 n=1 Tax=Nodularia harveyana UHCC-0300 TaxID=2974287 RepID=A0ABU5UJX2_9CYAN|nr:RuBisCO accumulation factor 1 [Nodularia harveyana]MEA5583380.1 RuBisCO accumulation factor 1 [Nodularia harveyana UHCC-0300]